MRQLYFLILLFTQFNGFAFSPPDIQTPPNIFTCIDYTVNLTMQNPQVLGALNPDLYTVSYFLTNTDAVSNQNEILNTTSYSPNGTEVIYVRVTDNDIPTDYSIVSFNIIIELLSATIVTPDQTVCLGSDLSVTFQGSFSTPPYTFTYNIDGGATQIITSDSSGFAAVSLPQLQPGSYSITLTSVQSSGNLSCLQNVNESIIIGVVDSPTINPPLDISIEQIPYVGIANFDLTSNDLVMTNGQPELTVSYHIAQFDAEAGINSIFPATSFSATNGQTIWAKVDSSTGCSVIRSFKLYITNPDIVFIPDANFKTLLLNSSSNAGIATDTGFQPIVVDINQDNEIQFSEALLVHAIDIYDKNISSIQGIEAFTNLVWFRCSKNNLTSVDLSSNINLDKLQIAENQLTSLDVSMLTNLVWLVCNNNFLTSLNVLPLVNLEEFNCSYNQLTAIDVTTLSNIYTLDVSHNQLSSIDLSGSESVVQLNLQNNQLASLDLSNLINAGSAFLNYNNLSTIDVSPLQSLLSFGISHNQLTTLDLSQNPVLVVANCSNNNLESLFVKNGANEFSLVLDNNPLNFICADEFQIEAIQNQLISIGNLSCVVNSYCSFTPGGNYNTITGNIRLDSNNNGCEASDYYIPFFRLAVDLNAMTTNSSVFSNNNGVYNLYTSTEGVYALIPVLENPLYFNVSPEPGIAILDVIDNSSTNLDFCITANGIHSDLEVVIAPVFPARPGFEAVYKIVYKNKGNQVLSQQYGVNFFYNQNLMNFVSASIVPSSQGPGGMQWDYANLMPFESRSIEVTMLINAPTDTTPVNIGDELTFTCVILPQSGDEMVQDNTFVFNQTVVGSYDPNDITCLEGDIVPPSQIGNYLHYFIRFENTGTAEAENIVVKTDIDPSQFDIASLQMLSTSHGAYIRMNGNRIEFIFQNIALESGGHGNILLKLKSNSTLQIGDSVANKANIYFDYNFPVETNNVETIFQSLGISNPILDSLLSIYPNPVSEVVNIKSNSNINIKTIELYDIQGRLLQTQLVNSVSTELNLLQRANGMYFIKINTDAGTKVEKLVKE